MYIVAAALITVILTFWSIPEALAGKFSVRAGSPQAKAAKPAPRDGVYRYEMVSVIKGVPGNRFLIERALERNWNKILFWKERFTIITAKEGRNGLADYLVKARYAEVRVTKQGVQFLIEHETDLQNRLQAMNETMLGNKKYEPHDCDRVIGECRFTVRERGKPPLFLLRKTSFKNGIWRDVESFDASRDPQKRSAVRDERTFSVDANGVLYDMQTTRRTGKQVELFQMTRLSPPLSGPKKPAKAAIPVLPEGAGNTLSGTCSKPSIDLSSGDQRWTLKQGDKKAFKGPSRDWKIHCGNGYSGTSCAANSHVRAIYGPGRVIFGCYEGAIPAKPFAG